jgi:signal transduction histidine kinase
VRFSVADTGIGIRPEQVGSLFQPFRQLDSGISRQHEGSGLGLTICRRLATLLGGRISAKSEWQKGSEFTVVIPVEKPPEP